MHTFFHGWRRKAGCSLLMMVLVVFVMWMRSRAIYDQLYLTSGLMITSIGGQMGLVRETPPQWAQRPLYSTGPLSEIFEYSPNEQGEFPDSWGSKQMEWRWDQFGFNLGIGIEPVLGVRTAAYFIPYWSLVLPLTVVSGYLILWKPRKRLNRDA